MLENLSKDQLISIIGAIAYAAMEELETNVLHVPEHDEGRTHAKLKIGIDEDGVVFSRTPKIDLERKAALDNFIEMMQFIYKVKSDVESGTADDMEILSAVLLADALMATFKEMRCPKCSGAVDGFDPKPHCRGCGTQFSLENIFDMAEAAFDSRA